MNAPLHKFTGASVARSVCATGEFALRLKPAAQARATASLPVAQTQQAGFHQSGQIRATGDTPQRSKNNGEMI
nr:hypothetical protein [uncultured Roseovarius sp.]